MLSLILATTEPSKVPFFLAGGVLAAWAVALSAIGLTQPDFPGGGRGQWGVILITGALVAIAMTSAVATA
jgi:hypothetical protein